MGLSRIALVGVRAQMLRILLQQVIGNCQRARVIQVLLAGRGIALERVNDLRLALIERLFARFLQGQIDQHFVVRSWAVALDAGIM